MLSAVKFADFKFSKKEMKIQNIPVENIRPNPYQPRKYFDRAALEELSDSIKEYGVIQPISVRPNGSGFEIVAGERRLRAAKLAGLATIPCIVLHLSDNDSAIVALIENLQRQNLNFIEEAEGYQNLMTDYGLTQEELAGKLGKSQSSIANKIRILKLPASVKKLLIENNLTERHARSLLRIPDPEMQMIVLYKIIDQNLNVKKTEELVEATLTKLQDRNYKQSIQKEKRSFGDIRLFTNTIRQSLEIMKKSGIYADYQTEEKDDFYEILIKIPYKEN